MDPFEQFDPGHLKRTLRKCKVRETTWENIRHTYQTCRFDYDPLIIDDADDVHFAETTNKFFDFKKAVTIKTRKTVFKQWVKTYWDYFKAETFDNLCENIYNGLVQSNQQDPRNAVPCINWIPVYGGMVSELPTYGDEMEIEYKKVHNIQYPLQQPFQRDDLDLSEGFINPNDISDFP
jgi:hypothetical protein